MFTYKPRGYVFFLNLYKKVENYTKLEVNRFDINVIIYLNFIEKHGIKI